MEVLGKEDLEESYSKVNVSKIELKKKII